MTCLFFPHAVNPLASEICRACCAGLGERLSSERERDIIHIGIMYMDTPRPMIHRPPEYTVNIDRNKHFRMIRFWTRPGFGLDFISFDILIHIRCFLRMFELNTKIYSKPGFPVFDRILVHIDSL